jgi:hypothetical protein
MGHELAEHELRKTWFPRDERYRRTIHRGTIGSDEEILALYNWAERLYDSEYISRADQKKFHPVTLAAEALICRELLGLEEMDAFRALVVQGDGTVKDAARLAKQWAQAKREREKASSEPAGVVKDEMLKGEFTPYRPLAPPRWLRPAHWWNTQKSRWRYQRYQRWNERQLRKQIYVLYDGKLYTKTASGPFILALDYLNPPRFADAVEARAWLKANNQLGNVVERSVKPTPLWVPQR